MQAEALFIKNDRWDYANGTRKQPEIIANDSVSETAVNVWDIATNLVI